MLAIAEVVAAGFRQTQVVGTPMHSPPLLLQLCLIGGDVGLEACSRLTRPQECADVSDVASILGTRPSGERSVGEEKKRRVNKGFLCDLVRVKAFYGKGKIWGGGESELGLSRRPQLVHHALRVPFPLPRHFPEKSDGRAMLIFEVVGEQRCMTLQASHTSKFFLAQPHQPARY